MRITIINPATTADVIVLVFMSMGFIFSQIQFNGQKILNKHYMKHFCILLTTLIVTYTVSVAQSSEDSVKATVNSLFEGMKNSDAGKIRQAFADSAILQTISRNKEGQIIIRTDAVGAFAEQVGKMEQGVADERITFEAIKIDGPLAIVWTPYKFYYQGKFSHCGVNSFQLVRINGNWKIQYLIDTRRRTGCE